jgi:hypothetical protein
VRGTNTAAVYCDRLTPGGVAALIRRRERSAAILDPVGRSPTARLSRFVLRAFGCEVAEADFFVGRLRTAEGVPLWVAAGRTAAVVSAHAARRIVERQPLLRTINVAAGGDTLVLYLARRIVVPLERQVQQVLIAEAMAPPGPGARVYLRRPDMFDPDLLSAVSNRIEIRFYATAPRVLTRLRAAALGVASAVRPYASRVLARLVTRRALPTGRLGVLLPYEGEVHADPTYRRQPHWLAPDADTPYVTYVLARNRRTPVVGVPPPNVVTLDSNAIAAIDRDAARDSYRLRLRSWIGQCLRRLISARVHADALAYAAAIRLLGRARVLYAVCRRLDARAAVFGELYLLDSDALRLIGPETSLRTIAFQYSNLAYPSPLMATTADVMSLWCTRFASLWTSEGFRPGAFSVSGYCYDYAFDLVRARAREWRRGLEACGATFVLCYFDENVAADKYGFTERAEHEAHLATLAQAVLDDATLGVVFKSQFRRHSPTVQPHPRGSMLAALPTGRVVDLHAGTHRNIVLPAEAGLVADMAIGHAIGATAALEAVLAGRRAVLLDTPGLETASSHLYRGAHVLFPSLDAALDAIARYRRGEPGFGDVGDWSSILRQFDCHGDGRSAERLRALVESALGIDAAPQAGRDARTA